MKRTIYILIAFLSLIFIAVVSIKPIIISVAKKQLENVFIGSSVSISGCSLKPFKQLTLFDIKVKKANVYNLKAKEIRFDYDIFSIIREKTLKSYLTAQTLGGRIEGNVRLKMDKGRQYLIELKFINLDLDKFVKDFNLDDKIQISGRLGGRLSLEGENLVIKLIDGNFIAGQDGGILTIKDERFLENVAKRSGQSLDILVESFKNYPYNKGLMKLSLKKGDLVFNIALDGEAGKRDLNIILHDFKFGNTQP